MTIPYLFNDQQMRPLRPDRCPREPGPGELCHIIFKGSRERATGPIHALALAFCRTHELRFTLYPPGYFPYGREPLVCVTSSGEPVVRDNGEPPITGTYFQAAIDGAAKIFWRGKAGMVVVSLATPLRFAAWIVAFDSSI